MPPRVAEFFAGIGLVRMALEQNGCRVEFANDISGIKHCLYAANFDDSHFVTSDIRELRGRDVTDVDIATASFPCTDLSLAGNRAGLDGDDSGLLWEFLRVISEMEERKPPVVMIENVPGFATSNNGDDLAMAIYGLNELGYECDIVVLDARSFVPQSRVRLFIVGLSNQFGTADVWTPSVIRPKWIERFVRNHPTLNMRAVHLPEIPNQTTHLADTLDRLSPRNNMWWDVSRLGQFVSSLSSIQADRLERMRKSDKLSWATAYRRTRKGSATWEIRADQISGCLRTTGGGSSKQAIVEAGRGNVRVRWMTAREYARLQGAPEFNLDGSTESQARFALGDAVCVPVVSWLASNYLVPAAAAQQSSEIYAHA